MEFLPDGGHAVACESGETMRDDRAGTTHRPSRRRWRLPPSRAIERWLNWRSSSTSIPIRSHRGKRSSKAELPMCSVPAAATERLQPAVDVKSLHAKIGELTLENDFLEGALGKAGLLSAKR